MWITGQLNEARAQRSTQPGRITLAREGAVAASGVSENREVSLYAPYGYAALPPEGKQILLLPCGPSMACGGVRMETASLPPGEIRLRSAGGAQIILKNNGEIVLNGLRITAGGTIVQA